MRIIYILSILIFLFGSTKLKSQESISLSNAIQKGLENNYSIRITNLNVDIAKNNNSWGTAGLFPKIDLKVEPGFSGNKKENDYNGQTFIGIDTSYSYVSKVQNFGVSPGVSLNWRLFNGFAVKITKEKLEQYQKLSEGNLAVVVENTIQAIYLAYYSALLDQEKIEIVSEIMALSLDRYKYVLERKQLGSAVTYDVLQVKIAYLSDSTNYLLQQMNVKNSIRNLSMLLGESSVKEYILTDDFEVLIVDYEYGDLFNKLQSENKTLKNQFINQEVLKKDIGLAKSSLYPTLSIFSSAGYPISNTSVENISSNPFSSPTVFNTVTKVNGVYTYLANFSLSYNLFNGFNTRSAIQNAKIQEQIGSLQIDEMKLQLSISLANMLDLYNIRKQLYQVTIESLETAQLNLDISNEKYKVGAINSFNYRDVQLIFINTAFSKLQATYSLIETHSELMRITGNIITEY